MEGKKRMGRPGKLENQIAKTAIDSGALGFAFGGGGTLGLLTKGTDQR